MSAHRQFHKMAGSGHTHEPGTNDTVPATVLGAVVEQPFSVPATGTYLVQRDAAGQVTVPATPTADTHAASKVYVDDKVVTGKTWKELVLISAQLYDSVGPGTGGILQAILATVATLPTLNSTLILSNGGTVETWTFKTNRTAPWEITIGATVLDCMNNIVAAIGLDSVAWSAVVTDGLDAYFAIPPTYQVVIYQQTPAANPDRMYGTMLGAQSDIKVVEFATGKQDYTIGSGTESDLPAADPAAKRFGFGRLFANLIQGEMHKVSNDNTEYNWDSDDEVWQQTSTGFATTEGPGIDVTAGVVSLDVVSSPPAEQQYGGLVRDRNPNGSTTEVPPGGYAAVQTDYVDLAISTLNEIGLRSQSRLDKYQTAKSGGAFVNPATPISWNDSVNLKPTLSERNTGLGSTAADIGNWGLFQGSNNNKTFLILKVANAGAESDYVGVELTVFV